MISVKFRANVGPEKKGVIYKGGSPSCAEYGDRYKKVAQIYFGICFALLFGFFCWFASALWHFFIPPTASGGLGALAGAVLGVVYASYVYAGAAVLQKATFRVQLFGLLVLLVGGACIGALLEISITRHVVESHLYLTATLLLPVTTYLAHRLLKVIFRS